MEHVIFLSLDLRKVLGKLTKITRKIRKKHLRKGFDSVCTGLEKFLISSKYLRTRGNDGIRGFIKLKADRSYTGYSWMRNDAEVAVAIAALYACTGDDFYRDTLDAMIATMLHTIQEPEWEVEQDLG